jgi:hypothetical protein
MAMGQLKRKSMHGVMSNTGFGTLTIFRKDGAIIEVPQTQITKAGGIIKKAVATKLDELTHERVALLENKGIKLFAHAGV